MARLNVVASPPTTTTHEGAPAKRINAEQELRRSVLACLLWEDAFYESGQSAAARIIELVPKVAPDTVAALAIEARERMKLRHVPLLLVRELARARYRVAPVLERIIQRPDELAEFLAIYWKDGRCPLANQVKRGLARAFKKFNAHSLAKYDREGAVRLRDVLFLSHAKPEGDEQAATWKALVGGALPAPDTWEVALSSGADKRATWERLLAEKKLGALALLRNLRNMATAGVSETAIRSALTEMRPDRVLPFRFVAAAQHAPALEDALEAAMLRCTDALPKLSGLTALLVDHSGSMSDKLSSKSDLSRFDAACALAMLVRETCEFAHVYAFSDGCARVAPRRGFGLRDALDRALPFGSTMTENAKLAADADGYHRIIIITDEQSHQALSNPKGLGYVVNVANYKHGVGYGKWTHIDGWSESLLDFIRESED